MKRAFFCGILLVIVLCARGAFAQDDTQHIPGTELKWGMSSEEARELLPGTEEGEILVTRQSFAGFPDSHPVTGQYYFEAGKTLRYVLFAPKYSYRDDEHWTVDFRHLEEFFTRIYGEPKKKAEAYILWESKVTQVQLSLAHGGWTIRLDKMEE